MKKSNLQFLTFPAANVVEYSAQYCASALQHIVTEHPSVFLLLSGGSAIEMYRQMFAFTEEGLRLDNVVVSLVDERMGEVGHPDSNETQLRSRGVLAEFEKRGASFIPFLGQEVDGGEQVSRSVSEKFRKKLTEKPYLLIFAGIGDDGHTLGWLPTQTAEKFSSLYDHDQPVIYYELDPLDSPNPFRFRLTITRSVIEQAQRIIVFSVGDKKKAALQKLLENEGPVHKTPALQLCSTPGSVVVLTDQTLLN